MEYIEKKVCGAYNFDKYFSYIKTIKNNLPKNVFTFASNWKYYSLESHSSLHDSWLERLSIEEKNKRDEQDRTANITVLLLGAYHDRLISLEYLDVHYYLIEGILLDTRGHGDILIHEIRLNKKNLIEHEVLFSDNTKFLISCSNIIHKEISLKGNTL